MCFQSYDPPKSMLMGIDLFKKCIDEGAEKGLCSVKMQYRGEPLLNPGLVEMVRYAKQKGVIEAAFNTNASLLKSSMAEGLIDAGLDKVICSVDGCSKDVYEGIRIGLDFDSVLENIRNMQELKKKKNSKNPIVRVQMVDTPKNHDQINDYVEFWGGIADQVAVEDMLDWQMEEENAAVLDNFACSQLWQRLIVLADGDVLPCCRAMRGGSEKLEVLDNVKTMSLSGIWRGEKMSALRELHRRGESHRIKMCRLCGLRNFIAKKKEAENAEK